MKIDKRTLAAANEIEKILKQMRICEEAGVEFDYSMSGLRRLGGGAFGVAYLMPDGNVLKLCCKEHDAYPTYAMWAQKNQGMGIPDIYLTHRVNESLFFAAMPAYCELTDEDRSRVTMLRNAGRDQAEPVGYLPKAVKAVLAALGDKAHEDMHSGNFLYCPTTGEYKITDPFATLNGKQDEIEAAIQGRQLLSVPQIKEQSVLPFADVILRVIRCNPGTEIDAGLQGLLNAMESGSIKLKKSVVQLVADVGDSKWIESTEKLAPSTGYQGRASWDFYVEVTHLN